MRFIYCTFCSVVFLVRWTVMIVTSRNICGFGFIGNGRYSKQSKVAFFLRVLYD